MRAPSPPTKNLLTITAVIEAGTGLGLVASPSLVVTLLLGSSLDAPVPLTIARLAGSRQYSRLEWHAGALGQTDPRRERVGGLDDVLQCRRRYSAPVFRHGAGSTRFGSAATRRLTRLNL